jgi:hypothetical protein
MDGAIHAGAILYQVHGRRPTQIVHDVPWDIMHFWDFGHVLTLLAAPAYVNDPPARSVEPCRRAGGGAGGQGWCRGLPGMASWASDRR